MGKPSKPRLSTSQSNASIMNIAKHKTKSTKKFDSRIKLVINSSRVINLDDNQEITEKNNLSTPIINLDDTWEITTLNPMHSSTPIKSLDLTKTRDRSYNNHTIDLTGTPDPGRPDPSSASSSVIVLDDDNISGCSTNDSQVTVIHCRSKSAEGLNNNSADRRNNSGRRNINTISDRINKMTATQKGQLLDMITENIFGGCAQPVTLSKPVPDTPEVTFIKEVVLGDKPSDTSTGSNAYNPDRANRPKTGLRMVVIDGSNVAMEHTHGRHFSVRGLKICIDYFVRKGHVVKAFVPRFRYIVQTAAEFGGVIVSGDNYRDIMHENAKWKYTIENRLLPFNWVGDMIMFPRDPLGKTGPTLERFLRHP